MKRHTSHIPVLLGPLLEVLGLRPGQAVVDCTLGVGGHSAALLDRVSPGGRLIGIDFDPANIVLARARLEAVGAGASEGAAAAAGAAGVPALARFDLYRNNFAALPAVLAEAGIERADAVLADLGVASPQIDDPDRGFSYRRPGPLDMRMDPSRGEPASTLVNRLTEQQLAEALLELGDEDDAAAIARLIVQRRAKHPIKTTRDLTAIVCEARDFTLKRAAGAKLHPAARTFQALRILVNRELANLERLLTVLPSCLAPGGVAAIISFHSGEDRRVKASFRDGLDRGIYAQISPDPVMAGEAETRSNPRSRSAKLRWARTGR
jgi:16S rRNA (cytosine1402-N4)-methyltransferase